LDFLGIEDEVFDRNVIPPDTPSHETEVSGSVKLIASLPHERERGDGVR
jgi:hypothetical protein